MKKEDRVKSAENISILKTLCTDTCSKDECENLRKYYMNQHASYMSSRIISVVLIEIMCIFFIINTGIDSLWDGVPYAEMIIYGVLWNTGGIYLLQMMVRTVWNTYELKLALDSGEIRKSNSEVSLNRIENEKNNKLHMYAKVNGKNKDLWFYTDHSVHRKITFTYNIYKNDTSGTKLVAYFVNDKKNDIFIMVKGRRVGDAIDKALKKTLGDEIRMGKIRMDIAKNNLKRKK